ncbi:DUF397 domain-containing protein [Haloechinothrix sp. LS1_15]|uniref:DUF397 domain-containing protein n=1 Tax=Haloechinothrix sp. LS1_15 TaxID=2652248 RepID=UPI0029458EC6|nr:DUF397 domain-containing protein [Haloechinothrix sp. LS1_15]MDV6011007.1 DUF397 domain-containing protein [Haloechinothrix sp. LS1_15]
MTAPGFTNATWITSSYSSGNGGNCVEISLSRVNRAVGVRDSKDRDGGHLTVPASAWSAFLHGVAAHS